MASNTQKPHFVLFPLMAQGHMIPMVDIAKLLAQRGVKISLITTPYNAARFDAVLTHLIKSGSEIQVIQLQFPCEEVGLPKGCENMDLLPSLSLSMNFFNATALMKADLEKVLDEMSEPPTCIISATSLPWTIETARKFHIPRIVFHGLCCYCLLCYYIENVYKVHESVDSDTEPFHLTDVPVRVEFTRSQLPFVKNSDFEEFIERMMESDRASYGVIVNNFEELESENVEEYKRVRDSDKLWCIGPVSLGNRDSLEKAHRGNRKSAIDEHKCLKWLDDQNPCSVIYACLGSLCNLAPTQLIEIGLGLEASKRPFIWVIREGKSTEEMEKWVLEEGFEERNKGRCLVIFGWAPQLMILSHVAIGGFFSHCGWNSILEGISSGLPIITCPIFGDQFMNEKLVVEILRVGVRVDRVEKCVKYGDDEDKVGVLVKKESVKKVIDELMDGEGREERRRRVRVLAETAKRAVEEGGSSHINLTLFIDEIMQLGRRG